MPYMGGRYVDEDTYGDAVADAAYDAFLDRCEPCGGSGEAVVACSGRHAYACGGPNCDDGYVDCPGCEDCEPED